MSSSPSTRELAAESARSAQPDRNPAYPQRVHFSERAKLEEVLRTCNQRLESTYQKLSTLTNHAAKDRFVLLFHQMQGARDQVADTVRRMPLEVGGLYHEDHERYEQAVAAFERTVQRWEKAGG